MPPRRRAAADDAFPLVVPLAEAARGGPGGLKPDALTGAQAEKKNYAQRFSNELAKVVAERLRPRYPRARVTPFEDGRGQEFTVGAAIDKKKTDVGVWDDAAGLVLGVSIKTYSFRDPSTRNGVTRLGRYQKNVKRNDMELRDEADVLHRRQPFAVLAALFFLPIDACWDAGTASSNSSFAHVVFTLRKRTGRSDPHTSRSDLFERVYVGLFSDDGAVQFFDVAQPPRRNQPPRSDQTLSLAELVDRLADEVTVRNVGSLPADRYTPDDASWSPPSEADDFGAEAPLLFEDALDDFDDGE